MSVIKHLQKIQIGLFIVPLLFICELSVAQKMDVEVVYSTDSLAIEKTAQQFLDSRLRGWNKYNRRSSQTTKRFLKKIQKQEHKIAQKLKATDSLRYQQLVALKSISADSLQQQLSDSNFAQKIISLKAFSGKGLDSLKQLNSFAQQYSSQVGKLFDTELLNGIQSQYSIEQYTQKVLQDRSKAISKLLEGSALAGQGEKLANINSQYRGQINYWKHMLNEPDAAEEKALDYLRGIEGFEEHINSVQNTGNNALAGKSVEELQAMGYQTKVAVNQQLQQQFGNQLSNVQGKAAEQLKQYADDLGKGLDKVKAIQQNVKETKSLANETKNNLKQGTSQLKKPEGFKNAMRGIPFWKRWDMQYNFQMQRASADGLKPVMLQTGINAAYKQTGKLSMGLGLDGSLGLGQGWKQLQLSYEGLVTRAFLDYKLLWGISLQGGYEKSLRPLGRLYTQLQEQYGNASNLKTEMGLLQDAAYLGIMKSYRINSKLQGTMFLGYNFLNDKTNISSPWIVRLGWKL